MKKKSSIILHSLFFVICSVLAVLCLYHIISIRRLNVKYTPAMTEESSRELDNPYRGFYQLSGYILSDNQKPEKSAAWCRKSCASNPYPLMLQRNLNIFLLHKKLLQETYNLYIPYNSHIHLPPYRNISRRKNFFFIFLINCQQLSIRKYFFGNHFPFGFSKNNLDFLPRNNISANVFLWNS